MDIVDAAVAGEKYRGVVFVGIVGPLELLGAFIEIVVLCVGLMFYGLECRVFIELASDFIFKLGHRHAEHPPQCHILRVETLLQSELLFESEIFA